MELVDIVVLVVEEQTIIQIISLLDLVEVAVEELTAVQESQAEVEVAV